MRAPHRNAAARRVRRALVTAVSAAALLMAGCTGGDGQDEGKRSRSDTTCDGRIEGTERVTVWFHTGRSGELDTLRDQVRDFNKSQKQVRVELVALPPTPSYTELVLSAAASGDLPDLLDFDGPQLSSYAWSGKLKPIDSCVPDKVLNDLLPSIRRQGTYAGRLWGIGTFDSGLGLYIRPSVLKKAGVRIPHGVKDAWTADELTGILHKLREKGYDRPLDLWLRYAADGGEWNTYGFAPVLWSAGGDLIDPAFRTADGYLNGPQSVRALTTLQNWVKAGYVDPGKDEDAFVEGRSPISWMGQWRYAEYTRAHPGDVAIVPLPDFGEGTATGMGSWQWGITSGATDGDAVWRFLAYLLRPDQVLRMSKANGAVPATNSAVKRSPAYGEGGAERLFIEQLRDGIARPRPRTPAYPAITEAFSHAFARIVLDGAPVRKTLDRSVKAIDKNLADHGGYPSSGP